MTAIEEMVCYPEFRTGDGTQGHTVASVRRQKVPEERVFIVMSRKGWQGRASKPSWFRMGCFEESQQALG